VDGHEVQVISGLSGDVSEPVSAALWIPSIETLMTGDLVFDGTHPWLGDSDFESRSAWRESLERLASFRAETVLPGHQRDIDRPDTPEFIDFMIQYLEDFDVAMRAASNAEEAVEATREKYPDLVLPGLMASGAKKGFKSEPEVGR
jgi:glyoxylase-like metal-dependent hydrolase (beta-lactamase superfamily II)